MAAKKSRDPRENFSIAFRVGTRTVWMSYVTLGGFILAVGQGVFIYLVLPAGAVNDKFLFAALLGITTLSLLVFVIFAFRRSESARYSSIETALDDIKNSEVTFENYRELERKKDEIEFERNVAQPLSILQIESEGFDIFRDLNWSFEPNVNILLGRNGYGKTRLLQTLVAALAKDTAKSEEIFNNSAVDDLLRVTMSRYNDDRKINTEEVIERNKRSFVASMGKVPILAIPDSRFVNKSRTEIGSVYDEYMNIREHGSHHFLYQKPYEPVIQNFLHQVCIDYIANRRILKNSFDIAILQLIQSTVRSLTDRRFQFSRIESTGQQSTFVIDVITEGDSGHPIPIQNISQGTQSILAMFGLVFKYLSVLYPDVKDQEVTRQPALVVIDEVDAHLHPVWQQRIVGLLRETFPKVQFILTAHSPLVVAGCREREVSVLRRQGEKFTLAQFSEDFIGWPPEAIYRKVFDVEELDETYRFFSALSPDRQRLQDRAEQLQSRATRSLTDEQELAELREKIRYIDRAGDAQTRRVQTWDLENQNSSLRQENAALRMEIQSLRAVNVSTEKSPGVQ